MMKRLDGSEVKPYERYLPELDPDNQPVERLFYLHMGVDQWLHLESIYDLMDYIRDADDRQDTVELKLIQMSNNQLANLPECE